MSRNPTVNGPSNGQVYLCLILIFIITAWVYHFPVAILTEHRPLATTKAHPIRRLTINAQETFRDLLKKKTRDLASTAAAYRQRRGRHPPPGFDKWFEFSQKHDAYVVEDFFDQIYDDLNPFWGVPPQEIQRQAKHYQQAISIRKGHVSSRPEKTLDDEDWIGLWKNLTTEIAEWLPDVDIPINIMDESRVIVPWENINNYTKAERDSRSRGLAAVQDVITQFTGLEGLDENPVNPKRVHWIREDTNFWDTARVGCAPDTPGRHIRAASNFSGPLPITFSFPDPLFTLDGYVQNWTANKDPCQQPEIRQSHGTFIRPLEVTTTHSLIPLFSGSKLAMNNDILLPAAMYWSADPRFFTEEQGSEWQAKKTKAIWRGVATGGRNTQDNWMRFHRHRFVAMMNATTVQTAEQSASQQGPNFVLPANEVYHLKHNIGTWLQEISDIGFVDLFCSPETSKKTCSYTDSFFSLKESTPMSQQYAYKFLPDVDGNSFSGRYRSFLFSTSLPIKATIYSEWHDSRLVPWVHFVPMQNSFVDLYGILEYFTKHDEEGERIATAGKEWAEKVLRREDMLVYVFRLLLEYARLCDVRRERMGFVAARGNEDHVKG